MFPRHIHEHVRRERRVPKLEAVADAHHQEVQDRAAAIRSVAALLLARRRHHLVHVLQGRDRPGSRPLVPRDQRPLGQGIGYEFLER